MASLARDSARQRLRDSRRAPADPGRAICRATKPTSAESPASPPRSGPRWSWGWSSISS